MPVRKIFLSRPAFLIYGAVIVGAPLLALLNEIGKAFDPAGWG